MLVCSFALGEFMTECYWVGVVLVLGCFLCQVQGEEMGVNHFFPVMGQGFLWACRLSVRASSRALRSRWFSNDLARLLSSVRVVLQGMVCNHYHALKAMQGAIVFVLYLSVISEGLVITLVDWILIQVWGFGFQIFSFFSFVFSVFGLWIVYLLASVFSSNVLVWLIFKNCGWFCLRYVTSCHVSCLWESGVLLS